MAESVDSHEQKVTKHEETELTEEYYYRKTRKSCPSLGVTEFPENHTKADVGDVNKATSDDFIKWKEETEKKIKQLQEHSDILKRRISKVKESAKTACDRVDTQIAAIYEEDRKIGEKIKEELENMADDEISKLTKLVEDDDKMTSEMKELIITEKIGKTETQDTRSRNLQTAVRTPYFSVGEVDVSSLKRQLGEVQTQTTFTSSFSLKEFNKKKTNETQNCYHFDETKGITWSIGVGRETMGLFTGYILKKEEEDRIKSVTATFNTKLLNIKDDSKSVNLATYEHTFKPGVKMRRLPLITFDLLKNGFIDDEEIFTVENTVIIKNIT